MEKLTAELKSLDEKQRAGLRINIDDYNARVDTHNGLLARHRVLLSENRDNFNTYEELTKQDATLVDQYNAVLKR
jgi:hypothetical protein